MKMSPQYCLLVVLCLYVGSVLSHVCLISPRQRGTMDISMAGSPTCTRHQEPCGGQDIETPKIKYKSGETVFIKWQQNLNHYEPGFPGYMDISIANSANSTDFTTLAVVTDKYVHAQDHQENYTAIIKLPDTPCDHCVIRARYNAHKPGETTFLQCSDISIESSSTDTDQDTLTFIPSKEMGKSDKRKILPLKRALKLRKKYQAMFGSKNEDMVTKLFGFAYNPFEPERSHYLSIDTKTGKTEMVSSFKFGIDTPTSDNGRPKFMVDEVISIDYGRNTSNVLLHQYGGREDAASTLYILGTNNGTLVQYSDIFQFKGAPINALSWYTYGTSATFRIVPVESGGWMFEAGTLDFGGIYTKRAEIPKPENLYVNFQWFDTDVNNYQKVYALMGNENAPDELNARLYIFDLFNGKFVQYTELDVSSYTYMSVHSYPGSGMLYAFSPGLWNDSPHGWYLVEIVPYHGTVTKICDIAPPGIFQRHYGGSVYQGTYNKSGFLYHVLRVEGSDADFLVGVNPDTCDIHFSDVTNLRHIHSIQRPAQ